MMSSPGIFKMAAVSIGNITIFVLCSSFQTLSVGFDGSYCVQ